MPRESGPGFIPGQETGEAKANEVKEGPGMFQAALRSCGISEPEYRSGLARMRALERSKDRLRGDLKMDQKTKENQFDNLEKQTESLKRNLEPLRRAEFVEHELLPLEKALADVLPDEWSGKFVEIESWRDRRERDDELRAGARATGIFPNNVSTFLKYFRGYFENAEWDTRRAPSRTEVSVGERVVWQPTKETADDHVLQIRLVELENFE